jgi:hypothetical protein
LPAKSHWLLRSIRKNENPRAREQNADPTV